MLALVVSATAAGVALGSETPHVKIAAPKMSRRTRTLTFSGATTSEFRNLRAYRERGSARCAVTFADKPRLAQEFGWNDVVPQHATGLVSFERKETVAAGDTGDSYVLCAYLVNPSGQVGARAQFGYRDPAVR